MVKENGPEKSRKPIEQDEGGAQLLLTSAPYIRPEIQASLVEKIQDAELAYSVLLIGDDTRIYTSKQIEHLAEKATDHLDQCFDFISTIAYAEGIGELTDAEKGLLRKIIQKIAGDTDVPSAERLAFASHLLEHAEQLALEDADREQLERLLGEGS